MLQEKAPKGVRVIHVRDTGLPLNTEDVDWAKYCRKNGLVFVTEDQKIRRRPQETDAFKKARIGYVESRMKAPAGPQLLALYAKHADAILRLARDPVPFCHVLTNRGLRRTRIDGRVRRSDR